MLIYDAVVTAMATTSMAVMSAIPRCPEQLEKFTVLAIDDEQSGKFAPPG